MKYALIFILLLIVASSGCIGDLNIFESKIASGAIISETEDIELSVQITPKDIKSQRTAILEYEIQNLRSDVSLKDININFYDLCGLSIEEGDSKYTIESLKPNRTFYNKIKLRAPIIDFDTSCQIKYRITYNSSSYFTQDIAVLSDSEYIAREIAGTLNDIKINTIKSSSPISINFRLSEKQPIRETKPGEKIYAYFSFSNIGKGYIDKIDRGAVYIKIPENLNGECKGFYHFYSYCFNTIEIILFSQNILIRANEGKQDPKIKEYNTYSKYVSDIRDNIININKILLNVNDYCLFFRFSLFFRFNRFKDEALHRINYIYDYSNTVNRETIIDFLDKSIEFGEYITNKMNEFNYFVFTSPFNFYNKQTQEITCTFEAKPNQPVDIKEFKILIDNFKYTLDNTININMLKR